MMLAGLLALSIATQPAAGVYPIVPPLGPLAKRTPEKQADLIQSWGFRLAGGPFKDDRLPRALRERGIRTLRIVSVFEGANHWKKHPESRPIDSTGTPLELDDWYAGVCPNFEPLRRSKLRQIGRLLESGRYDVLVLDFVRWPVLWERPHPKIPKTCYCEACRERFQRDTNVRLPPGSIPEIAKWIDDNHREAWERWRAERITSFVRDVRGLRDRAGKGTLIGVVVVPWTDERLREVAGQDLRALAPEADVFLPMSYNGMVEKPVNWVTDVNVFVAQETKKLVWPIVLFDEQRRLTRQQWDTYLSHALRGSKGLVAFPFRSVFKSPGLGVLTRQMREFAADQSMLGAPPPTSE
jgi:hypothetical protein